MFDLSIKKVHIARHSFDRHWVISRAGQPARQPNLKKPTALRGAVGVWDCESSESQPKKLLVFPLQRHV